MTDVYDIDVLREILDYDKVSGKLYWKDRVERDHSHWTKKSAVTHNNKMRKEGVTREAGSTCKRTGQVKIQLPSLSGRVPLVGHRVIWALVMGEWPTKENPIRHKDGDKGNNSFENLEKTTLESVQHGSNPRKDNKQGVRGVHFNNRTGRYVYELMIDGQRYTGSVDTLQEAADKREEIKKEVLTE